MRRIVSFAITHINQKQNVNELNYRMTSDFNIMEGIILFKGFSSVTFKFSFLADLKKLII